MVAKPTTVIPPIKPSPRPVITTLASESPVVSRREKRWFWPLNKQIVLHLEAFCYSFFNTIRLHMYVAFTGTLNASIINSFPLPELKSSILVTYWKKFKKLIQFISDLSCCSITWYVEGIYVVFLFFWCHLQLQFLVVMSKFLLQLHNVDALLDLV